MKHKLIILTFLYLLLCLQVLGQINIGGEPYSFKHQISDQKIPIQKMPSIDLAKLEQEDRIDAMSDMPYRFGHGFKTEFNLTNSGIWTTLQNGDRIWRLTIECKNAKSINLTYDSFWLPKGSAFYIYSSDKSTILGGFTEKNNKGTREQKSGFATALIKTDQIVLEYYEPKNVEKEGIISINQVVHGYRGIEQSESFDDAGSCQVNINCIEGSNWQQEKKAVAIMVINGTRLCTGSLINNTCNDFSPLFLTADHCFGGSGHDAVTQPNGSTMLFMWDYESSSCSNPSTEPSFLSTAGATVLASDDRTTSSDFALLELTEDPADLSGFTPFYPGWDRTSALTSGGVGIHHPRVDIKKIATHSMIPTGICGGSHGTINRWLEVYWDATTNGQSVTEGGSSGSPIFDNANHRILGQLYGGNNCSGQPNCSDPDDDEGLYGAIAWSWDNNGDTDNRRRLQDWLDPCGTGQTVINGINGTSSCPTNITHSNTISSNLYEASNSIVSTTTIGANQSVTYDAGSFISLNPGFTADSGNGSDFLAHIDGCNGMRIPNGGKKIADNTPTTLPTTSFAKQSTVEDVSKSLTTIKNIPNPFSNHTTFQFELPEASKVQLEIYDVSGKAIAVLLNGKVIEQGQHQLQFNATDLPNGMYIYKLSTETETITKKMILKR